MAGEFSGPINRTPPGLLGYLGLKNLGQNPDLLSGVLQTTWDTSEMYLASQRLYRQAFIAPGSIGEHTFDELILNTPGNWAWVENITLSCSEIGTGGELGFCGIFFFEKQAANLLAVTPSVYGIEGDRPMVTNTAPFWLPPNSQVGVFVNRFKLGSPPSTIACTVKFAILPS